MCPGALAAAGWSQDGAQAGICWQSWGLWVPGRFAGLAQRAETLGEGIPQGICCGMELGTVQGGCGERAGKRLLHRKRGWSCFPVFVLPLVGEGQSAVAWPGSSGLGCERGPPELCSSGNGRRRPEQAQGVSCSCGMCDLIPLLCGCCFGHRPWPRVLPPSLMSQCVLLIRG